MGSSFAVWGEAGEARVDDVRFAVEEAVVPEEMKGEVKFEGAADGVGCVSGELCGFEAKVLLPGFRHLVAAGEVVMDAGVTRGASLAEGRAGASGF